MLRAFINPGKHKHSSPSITSNLCFSRSNTATGQVFFFLFLFICLLLNLAHTNTGFNCCSPGQSLPWLLHQVIQAALTAHPACSHSPKGLRAEGLASCIAKSTHENRLLPENCWEEEHTSMQPCKLLNTGQCSGHCDKKPLLAFLTDAVNNAKANKVVLLEL